MVDYLAVANYDVLLGGQVRTARWLLLLIPPCTALGFSWAAIRPNVNYQAKLVGTKTNPTEKVRQHVHDL